MTIDALRVTAKISGKTRRNRERKGADATIPYLCAAICGLRFWRQNCATRLPRCYYSGAVRSCLSIAICLCLLLAASAFAGDDDDKPAPRFRAKTTSGESFNNESVKGKVVLLEFWTTWCQYCHQEESLVEQINKEFADKGLIVLAIDVAESKKTVKKYLEQHPRACRIVLTEDTNLAAMYQANVYPIYVVIDRDGNIAGEQRGAAGERALRHLVASAGIEAEEKPDEN
jgi:thiol-disulfide isomerase/thioredoxin